MTFGTVVPRRLFTAVMATAVAAALLAPTACTGRRD